jgi:uncharacterized protein (DUF1800 family)
MITRREFHAGLTALMSAGLAGGRAGGAVPDEVALYLNRLTFGATPESRAAFLAAGHEAWLDAELARPAGDANLDKRLAAVSLWIEYGAGRTDSGVEWTAAAEARRLQYLDAAPETLLALLDWEKGLAYEERVRPADEVIAVSILRAVHAPAQLREVMAGFWHEHFSVNAQKDEVTGAFFPPYDAMLREHALGNFRVLLGNVARSPAMLHYLNNDASQASPANENYARELLELHTLGQGNYLNDQYEHWADVPGATGGAAEGYIDDDVYEVARAFTGWTIGDGRWVAEGETTPRTGTFAYIEGWHDPYQKRVLGRELPALAAPMADGEAVLDMLAAHPGTARFVTGKILRRLGIEAPTKAYRARVARVFTEGVAAPDQIAKVIRTIVLDPEFVATPPAKLRRPFEFAAAMLRATGAEVSPSKSDVYWHLARAGWTQHQVRPPTGHSDLTRDWATTVVINGMVNLALYLHADWMSLTDQPLGRAGGSTLGAAMAHWQAQFGLPEGVLTPVLATFEGSPGDAMPTDAEGRDWVNTGLVAAAALRPEFLFR